MDIDSSSAWGNTTTKFFYDLTPDRIFAAVEKTGLRCTGRLVALNSLENRVYEVEIEIESNIAPKSPSERFRVLKFYRPGRWSREQILEEHEFIRDLAAQEIPVVAPVEFRDGSTLHLIDGAEIYFSIFPKQGGRMLDELNESQLLQIGRLLGRLHNVGDAKVSQHRIELSPETFGRDNLDLLFESEILPAGIEARYEQIVEDICDICSPWFMETEIQRVHGDCHAGNLLWGQDGVVIVDFDDMVRGPCVQDLWLLAPGRDDVAKKRLDTLLLGYEQMRPFPRESLRLIEPLRALRMVNFNVWIAKRWYDPVFPKVFPNFGSDRYWQEELQALHEILELMQGVDL